MKIANSTLMDGKWINVDYYFNAFEATPMLSAKYFNSEDYYFGIIYNYKSEKIKLFHRYPNYYDNMTKLEKREFTASLEKEFNISIS